MLTLAELATTQPAASRVFHRHRLDFCCGGNRPLDIVCQERGIDVDSILDEIKQEQVGDDDIRWTERPVRELIEHIVARYHEPLRPELDRLLEMAQRVEVVHGEKPSCPRGLAEHLNTVREDVLTHLQKEEQILFPMIAANRGTAPRGPITVMLHEHDGHAESLEKTRELTDDLVPPPEACNTWRALYLGLAELERELMDHIHLENNVLFPAALRTH